MTKTNSKATLLHEWESDKERYRLVAVADFTRGYEDKYVVEHLTQDALGEPTWKMRVEWPASHKRSDSSTDLIIADYLVAAIKALVQYAPNTDRPEWAVPW